VAQATIDLNGRIVWAQAADSPVAGQATVFIFPDPDTGNTTYKAVQRSAQAKPINDIAAPP